MSKHLMVELDKLKRKLLEVSSLVEQNVSKSVRAVVEGDDELAREVIAKDQDIDTMEVEVEEECLKVLALYQPVANDLRFVVVTLKINNDLERIGDLAVNIAERALFLAKNDPVVWPEDFDTMSIKTRQMLKNALDALVNMDVALAHQVCLMDDDVDAINRQMYQHVYSRIKKDPERVEIYTNFVSVSKHLERIADYATNISMDVIYMIEGTIIRHHRDDLVGS